MKIDEMNILILGASSFIGKAICKKVNAKKIIAVIRPDCAKKKEFEPLFADKKIEIIEYDIFGENNYAAMLKQIDQCDACIMLAWQGTKKHDRNMSYLHEHSSRMLLKFMKESAAKFPLCKFIMCGTQAEYGSMGGIITEQTVCQPCTEYGKQKYYFYKNAMMYSNQNHLDFIELRFHSVVGKDDNSEKMIQQVICKLKKGEYVHMNSDCAQMWNLIEVEELCEGIIKAITVDLENGAYNIGSADNRELRVYLREISRIVCGENRIFFGMQKDNHAPDFVFCCDKFFNAVQWKPQPFEQQIKSFLCN